MDPPFRAEQSGQRACIPSKARKRLDYCHRSRPTCQMCTSWCKRNTKSLRRKPRRVKVTKPRGLMPSKNPASAAKIHKGAPKPSKLAYGPAEWRSQLPEGDNSRE